MFSSTKGSSVSNALKGFSTKRFTAIAATGALLFGAAACGGGSGDSGGGSSDGLPTTVNIVSTTDLTGLPAFAGTSQVKGAQLAVEQINAQGYLGDTKLNLISKDTANSPQTAATLVTEAAADKSVSAILGTTSSGQSVAVAPIAQNQKVPILFTQSGSAGTVIGNYTFRITAPMETYYADKALSYLQTQNVKSIAVIYNSASPTLQELGEKTIPDNAGKYGYKVTSSSAVTGTTSDFSAAISKALAENPDVVAPLLVGGANSTFASQLRQAGFSGTVLANAGASAGNLKPAGAAGTGWIWPTDFSYLAPGGDAGTKYVADYKAKYNEDPLNYSAEGYDAIWMIARAIKEGGSADRADLQKALANVAKTGFEGAMGQLKFEEENGGYDLRVDGVLVGWDGASGGEILVK